MSALVEMEVRRAPAAVSTWNETARTVEVVWAAGADVKRYSWSEGGWYVERLRMTPDAVDLSRLNGGASLLDAHAAYSMADRVGVVVVGSARIENGQGVATVQLLTNEGGNALADACRSGAGFLVSVGYSTSEYERDEGDGTSLPIITSTRWLPMEISAVPIPADPAARTRSHKENPMPQTTTTPRAPGTISPDVLAERTRAASIRSIGEHARLAPEIVESAVADGVTVDAFRTRAFDEMVERQKANNSFPFSARGEGGGGDRAAQFRTELVEVLAGRSSNGGAIARQFLESTGVRTGSMGDREIGRALTGGSSIWNGQTRGMHGSDDFSMLVGAAASTVLLERFQANPSPLKRFSRLRNAVDFRDQKFYRPGEAPQLLKVGEHGEIKSGSLSEESNGYRIETFGRMFALTFQASVNDGLGAFADFLNTFAESAIQLEGDLFADLLDGNGPRLDDGLTLFHASHGNLAAAGGAPTIETVSEGVLAMRTQRNINGNAYAGTAPTALLVGPKLELRAKQLVTAIQANDSAAVNPHRLEVIVEDRFGRDFAGWFLLADPTRRPAFIHGGLESEGEAPKVDSRAGWDVLGTEYRVVHHFGAGVHDYRAIYFNPGS